MSNVSPQMRRLVFITGLLLLLVSPLIATVGLGLSQLMPGCTGGSSGPASGCNLIGVNLDWFIQLATLAFLASFFSVPLGVAAILGGLLMLTFGLGRPSMLPYGIYSQGRLLSLQEGIAAVNLFDRAACNGMLRQFGEVPSAESEPLSQVRVRCISALSAVAHDGA